MDKVNFSTVTEITGNNVTQEQIQRMVTRYLFAAEFCGGKDVLEVACGTGQGLGLLAKRAGHVTGGDIDENILSKARHHYKGRNNVALKALDAHKLEFSDGSFDVVVLYEAIYYLSHPEKFISEAMRVLRKDGILLISTANKELPDFNPSPYSHQYFSAKELFNLLARNGFTRIDLFGDCLIKTGSMKNSIVSFIKKTAVSLHLIPKTMKGKELFKRMFFGKLRPLPPELEEGTAEYARPVPVSSNLRNNSYKVIFATARKKG